MVQLYGATVVCFAAALDNRPSPPVFVPLAGAGEEGKWTLKMRSDIISSMNIMALHFIAAAALLMVAVAIMVGNMDKTIASISRALNYHV